MYEAHTLAADDVVSNVSVVVGWLLTIAVATYQLRAGRLESDRAKREELRTAISVEAFRQVASAASDLTKSLTAVMAPFGSASTWLKSPEMVNVGSLQRLVKAVLNAHLELHRAWGQFVFAIESYQIVLLPFEHLRKYIGFIVLDTGEEIRRVQALLGYSPTTIDDAMRLRLATETDMVWRHVWDIMTYVGDYRVEVMNSLTGDLFARRVPRRQPLQSASKTLITLATKEAVEAEEQRRTEEAILAVREPVQPIDPPA